MGYFGSTLSDILQGSGTTQTAFAGASGLPAPQLNRYIRGVNQVPHEILPRILAAIPAEHRARLLLAYLRDIVPDDYREAIRVETEASRLQEAAWEPLVPGLDRELDSILRTYAELATRHREIRDMLKGFLSALGKLPPAGPAADFRS